MALNVLIVDDSAVMRAMIIKTLRLSGIPLGDVFQAANGVEGLSALDNHWIDLALVDINMPVMDGEEMIDRVRQSPDMADMPLVVVSTESSPIRIERIQSKGARFVHKPFTPESLRATILQMTGICDDGMANGDLPDGGQDF